MLKYIFSFIIFVFGIGFSFGLSGDILSDTGFCENMKKEFTIGGPDIVKVNIPVAYTIKNIDSVNWSIYRDNKEVVNFSGKLFSYSFVNAGNVKIRASFKYKDCFLVIDKKVKIYKKIVLTFMSYDKNFVPFSEFENKNIFFSSVDIAKEKDILLKNSDYILLSKENAIDFFVNNKILSKDTKYIIFVDSSKSFFAKVLIPYVKNIYNNNIYLYDTKDFFTVLSIIYNNKKLDERNLLAISHIASKPYLILSYFINKLIEANISIDIISIILLALCATFLIAFIRQIIGFSVFGIYTPLLVSILILTLGAKIVLLFFIISVFSHLLTYFITKKIYVLYSAKISLHYTIYVVLSIIIFGLLLQYHLIQSEYIVGKSVLIMFFIMPLLTKSIIKEDTKIFSKTFLLFILEFIFISFVVLLVFKISFLKYILIAYPDILWILIALNILIGRFTGLQLLEYIRFYPLIKAKMEEEE